jgi:hypothetical protein
MSARAAATINTSKKAAYIRGTTDRKANLKEPPSSTVLLMVRVAKASSETRRVNHNTTGKNDNGT